MSDDCEKCGCHTLECLCKKKITNYDCICGVCPSCIEFEKRAIEVIRKIINQLADDKGIIDLNNLSFKEFYDTCKTFLN